MWRIRENVTNAPSGANQTEKHMNTSIERTEQAIKSGNFKGKVYEYRVYTLTLSPEHLKAGADFMLYESFNDLHYAQQLVDEINATDYEIAVLVY